MYRKKVHSLLCYQAQLHPIDHKQPHCVTISNHILFILNREEFKMDSYVTSIISAPCLLTTVHFLGDITTTHTNISAHYDIGNMIFTAFLSKDMNYSSAIFKDFNEYLQPQRGTS
ncbi:hypothetical protein M422DRAFT_267171 [Sphaerobolus stellatus SS14]|uniref:Uncharacterized protein n=1 Tax=Sphaerobolus stellatus (strain SS14) TaxID=990650 RepID=A0A0C9TML8_SPHS4|nr:hypothetical protein M422DRAFT_267171 [Sphaerobolus stellatus SS14]